MHHSEVRNSSWRARRRGAASSSTVTTVVVIITDIIITKVFCRQKPRQDDFQQNWFSL